YVVGCTRCRVVGHTVQRAVEREHGPVSVIAVFGDRGLEELTVIVPVPVFGTDIQMQHIIVFEPVGAFGRIVFRKVGLVVVLVVQPLREAAHGVVVAQCLCEGVGSHLVWRQVGAVLVDVAAVVVD